MSTKVYALWYGGSGYSSPEIPRDVEVFPTVNYAREAFRNRYQVGDRIKQDFTFAGGDNDSVLTPGVGGDSEMWLYFYDPRGEHDFQPGNFPGESLCPRCGTVRREGDTQSEPCSPVHDAYPDRRLYFGPRGGVREEPC
jgi:hypothetical protein